MVIKPMINTRHPVAAGAAAKILLLFFCCLAPAKSMASANHNPRAVSYDRSIRLRGVVYLEYDLSMIDSDASPVRDPKEARRRAALAKKSLPPDLWWRLAPRPHLILHLDRPITIAASTELSFPLEENVAEIDFGPPRKSGPCEGRAMVVGKLWHACTVHHLRPVMGDVISIQ